MARPAPKRHPSAEPTLAEAIRESGETEVSAVELALRSDREDLRFLGREFLTWLLFHVETAEGQFDPPDHDNEEERAFRIGFGERLKLASVGADVDEVVLKGGSPADSLDSRFALSGGLSVREAELILVHRERTFELALTSDTFDLKKVKLPVLLTDDEDDAAEERLTLLHELDRCLARAFEHFLALRLVPAWTDSTVPAMRRWLADSLAISG